MEKQEIINKIISIFDDACKRDKVNVDAGKVKLYDLKRFLQSCEKPLLELIFNNGAPDVHYSHTVNILEGFNVYARSNRVGEFVVFCFMSNVVEFRLVKNNYFEKFRIAACLDGIAGMNYDALLFDFREAINQVLN